jgi:putative DNA primase/helicase
MSKPAAAIDLTDLRLGMLARGFHPVPVMRFDATDKAAGKRPTLLKWEEVCATADEAEIRRWSVDHGQRDCLNTGLLCGHVIGLDIDVPDYPLACRINALADAMLPPTPLIRIGKSPKSLRAFRAEGVHTKASTPALFLPDGTKVQIEALGKGNHFVSFGTHPDTKLPYTWPHQSPLDVRFEDLPVLPAATLRAFLKAAEAGMRAAGARTEAEIKDAAEGKVKPAPRAPKKPPTTIRGNDFPPPTYDDVREALAAIPNRHDWKGWVKIGAAIYDALADDGEDLFIAWSEQSSRNDPDATLRKWKSFSRSKMDISDSTLFWEARQNGWKPQWERERDEAENPNRPRGGDPNPPPPDWPSDDPGYEPPPPTGWRPVAPEEVFEPGRHFRMNQTTGVSEVYEPPGALPPPAPEESMPDYEAGYEPPAAPTAKLILCPGTPLASAREFLRLAHTEANQRTLHHQNATFYSWAPAQTHYIEIATEEMLARLYNFLDEARQTTKKPGVTAPFSPTKSKVSNVLEALAAAAQLPCAARPPSWLDTEQHPPAGELVSCTNGLLHLPTRNLLPHSPAFFSLNALEFAYQHDAPPPKVWLEFLNQLWPGDEQSIEMLQEMFGLMLTGDTSHQKAFLLVGPKRSGKGTIARVMTRLLGQADVCGPTLSGLGETFGLAPLIGKRLAIISDARLGGKIDHQVVVERLLAITGEDSLSVNRKNRDHWTGQLQTRFMVLTNELPKLADASGALASRFLILLLTNSFYRKEDLGLTARIIRELPGILNWSLDGWQRLQTRGHFVQPASSAGAQRDFEDLGSPIGAFLRDRCVMAQFATCRPEDLYNAWCDWCRGQNISHVSTVQMFGRDLRAAVGALRTVQHRGATGVPERHYQGIELKRGEAH